MIFIEQKFKASMRDAQHKAAAGSEQWRGGGNGVDIHVLETSWRPIQGTCDENEAVEKDICPRESVTAAP